MTQKKRLAFLLALCLVFTAAFPLPGRADGSNTYDYNKTMNVGEVLEVKDSVHGDSYDHSWSITSNNSNLEIVSGTTSQSCSVRATADGSATLTCVATKVKAYGSYRYVSNYHITIYGDYTVTLDAAGGSVSPSSITVSGSGKYEYLPVPTRTDYNFMGWFTASRGGSRAVVGDSANLKGDATLYARWDTIADIVRSQPSQDGASNTYYFQKAMTPGESATFTDSVHSSGYSLAWAVTGGSDLLSVQSGASSANCSVKANRAGTAILTCEAYKQRDYGTYLYESVYIVTIEEEKPQITTPVNTAPQTATPATSQSSGTGQTSAFTDVSSSAYYAKAVSWAVDKGITNGMGNNQFGSDSAVTRGQAMTFLWRAAGSPNLSSESNRFVDVAAGDYFADAVLWAVKNGITNGTDATHFSPNDACSYNHMLTFLYRANGEPGKSGSGEWYQDAVNWANYRNMLTAPQITATSGNCPRRDVAYFLYQAYSGANAGSAGTSTGAVVTPAAQNTSTPAAKADEFCHTCGGDGFCPTCDGHGAVTCTKCDGDGYCTACDGLGYHERTYFNPIIEMKGIAKVDCSVCDGSGKCSRCGGAGELDCTRCDGGICPSCGGLGWEV